MSKPNESSDELGNPLKSKKKVTFSELQQIHTIPERQILKTDLVKEIVRREVLQAMQDVPMLDLKSKSLLRDRLISLSEYSCELYSGDQEVDIVSDRKMKSEGDQEDVDEMFLGRILDLVYTQQPMLVNIQTIRSSDQVVTNIENRDESLKLPITGDKVSKLIQNEENEEHINDNNGIPIIRKITLSCREDEFVLTLKRTGIKEIELDDITLPINAEDPKSEKRTFTATSFIVHVGTNHYVTYILDQLGWFCYDDAQVIEITDPDHIAQAKKQAYIVKYSNVENPLPQHQYNGADNFLSRPNACWANAGLAFLLSMNGLQDNLRYQFNLEINHNNNALRKIHQSPQDRIYPLPVGSPKFNLRQNMLNKVAAEKLFDENGQIAAAQEQPAMLLEYPTRGQQIFSVFAPVNALPSQPSPARSIAALIASSRAIPMGSGAGNLNYSSSFQNMHRPERDEEDFSNYSRPDSSQHQIQAVKKVIVIDLEEEENNSKRPKTNRVEKPLAATATTQRHDTKTPE